MNTKQSQVAELMQQANLVTPFDAIAELERAVNEQDDFHLRFSIIDNVYQQTIANPEWRSEYKGITDAIYDPKILGTLGKKPALAGREAANAIRSSITETAHRLVELGRYLIPVGQFIMAQNKLLEENGNRTQYDDAVNVFMEDFLNGPGKLAKTQVQTATGHIFDGTLTEFTVCKQMVAGNVDPMIRSEIDCHVTAIRNINSLVSQMERYILEGINWNPSNCSVYHELAGTMDIREMIQPLVNYLMELKLASLMWCLKSAK